MTYDRKLGDNYELALVQHEGGIKPSIHLSRTTPLDPTFTGGINLTLFDRGKPSENPMGGLNEGIIKQYIGGLRKEFASFIGRYRGITSDKLIMEAMLSSWNSDKPVCECIMDSVNEVADTYVAWSTLSELARNGIGHYSCKGKKEAMIFYVRLAGVADVAATELAGPAKVVVQRHLPGQEPIDLGAVVETARTTFFH